MGIYLDPGNKGFWEAVRSEIYVDKTGLIACTNRYINTEQKFVCVSRPRRFGKSMALKMLAAYYSCGCSSRGLFRGREIEKDPSFEEHLNQYAVICLNMQRFLIGAGDRDMTDYLQRAVIADLARTYGEMFSEQETMLAMALEHIYQETGKPFIFLIDEWDCVMREQQGAESAQKRYLDFLRDLLKDRDYVALAYMTGILPIKKYGQHQVNSVGDRREGPLGGSALNMFWEYSMLDQGIFERYTGFTEEEVRGLCEQYGMDPERVSRWYDGYKLKHYAHLYNPQSVVEAMHRQALSDYWIATETYEALKIYMDMDFDGLRTDMAQMLGGGHVAVNTRTFQNDMRDLATKDDVLTLLIHLGYLAYDIEKKEAFIPNKEIAFEFENAMSVGGWAEVMRVLKASDRLLEDVLRGDEQRVAMGLDWAHTEIASILTYNDEDTLCCAIGLAFYSARKDYKMIRELPTGLGFADVVFLPLPASGKPALVIELKYGKPAAAAIRQIKDRQYTRALEGYSGEILLVGISYDKDRPDKPHSCVIEKWEKG